MVETDSNRLRLAHLLVLAAVVLAAAWLASVFGSAGGASSLEGLLPDGERPNWYWTRMENSGFEVTAVKYESYDFVVYQVSKNGESFAVQLELDPESGVAAAVTIVGNQVADDRH